MKRFDAWPVCVLILSLAVSANGATTFVQNFEGITSNVGTPLNNATTELDASYAVGSKARIGSLGGPGNNWTVENGKWGKAVSSLTGANNGAMLYNRASNMGNTLGTIEFWWKPTTGYDGRDSNFITCIIDNGWPDWKDYNNSTATGTFSFLWKNGPQTLLFAYRDNTGVLYEATLNNGTGGWSPTVGEWHHIAMAYSATGLQVFADGQGGAVTSCTTWNTSNMATWLSFGADPMRNDFNGAIDSFRLSDTVLYSGTSYTVPTTQFIPEPMSVVMLLGGLMMLWRRDPASKTPAA